MPSFEGWRGGAGVRIGWRISGERDGPELDDPPPDDPELEPPEEPEESPPPPPDPRGTACAHAAGAESATVTTAPAKSCEILVMVLAPVRSLLQLYCQ
jgi:hypothetical protein